MPRGRPRSEPSGSFETTRRRHGSTARGLKERAEENSRRLCSCPGCDQNRSSLSTYCRKHRDHYDRHGHPILDNPSAAEIAALVGVVKDWIENGPLLSPFEREAFKRSWGTAVRRLHKHPRYAVHFGALEGVSGYTAKTKAAVLLAWYYHREGKPLGAAMLRYMAVRLWADLRFTLPPGKYNLAKERTYFVSTVAGKFVVHHSGFAKTLTEEKIVGWESPVLAPWVGEEVRRKPITQRETKKVRLSNLKSASIARAIGAELRGAIEHVFGPQWSSNTDLRTKAADALATISATHSRKVHSLV
jgi:hypothetical protein